MLLLNSKNWHLSKKKIQVNVSVEFMWEVLHSPSVKNVMSETENSNQAQHVNSKTAAQTCGWYNEYHWPGLCMVMTIFYSNWPTCWVPFSTHGKTRKKYQMFVNKFQLFSKNPVEQWTRLYRWGVSGGVGLRLGPDPPGSRRWCAEVSRRCWSGCGLTLSGKDSGLGLKNQQEAFKQRSFSCR